MWLHHGTGEIGGGGAGDDGGGVDVDGWCQKYGVTAIVMIVIEVQCVMIHVDSAACRSFSHIFFFRI